MAPEPTPAKRRWSPIDVGAGVAVLLALGGVIWSPKLSGAIAQATGAMQPVLVTVDVRGASVADPAALIAAARAEGKVSIVIRNEPHGTVKLRELVPLQRRLVAVQPNGSVVTAVDPNQAVFGTLDARFVLEGQGRKTGGGVVFGNQNLKIGAPVELEGAQYRFGGTVSALRLENT
ncbi:DUF4330 domain-containing protein [Synechococcus sp. Tobar12-5m-g]|jgi:hypothetical protein|uniref:DUF4330 domain-containing protein n=1 Tax=unclassified Synechococcus TaxID=2626047 RepID=UPI0020CE66B4|nr:MULTISPECIES: DUF4330 domain-containing protein [unclassified Synechococcus]MCP9772082.1 DUF4330 domain-containing protein [Synechococcus sp. Tobar12-5m-g]MCP9873024.1 DUF4330 domain-containing protein [Synechococcus sp. Cruz CV-v-12]